ncbi:MULTISPECIES: sulfatase-like hydrolase/transferase [unclassified Ruegeria]|uniref:sulfatase-like hydrolase/transferase n=1 Tax=unclassified Ruegeria TaxID=2625375 RepID=UPI001491677E|nr:MULTISPECIES: sulfatase-like hydrolase/transferase [unclassified Ruegeria]NOD78498.1 sulfatase-like hydrolase/transferase [Ruegeria sp. HKCCD4332]UUV08586.1 sulfatase-like hydrolase/transferase [Ruegeria sp. YS9]
MKLTNLAIVPLMLAAHPLLAQEEPIIHDSEYYILLSEHGDQWAEDDAAVDARLAEFREKNGGKPPNIINILIDDLGFGDMGIPELNALRGYETPNINDFSDEALRMVRMYTEPSCTPTRVAQMTGRLPVRIGMGDTAVDIAGFGLPGSEKILPEVLKDAGYATSHIGKWHMGDIPESWAMNNGFDYAQMAVHQQGQLTIFNDDAIHEGVSVGNADYVPAYTIDSNFRPDASAMMTTIEGEAGGPIREIRMEPGERWNALKYNEMNQAFQDKAMEELARLAGGEEPFFLQYWPLLPLDNTRAGRDGPQSPNGGLYADKMQLVDEWLGAMFDSMEELGVADNTIVVVMGDNGHFTKYSPESGYTPMIFRGGKADTTEGGVRTDAFIRWPGMIEADGLLNSIVHVSDMYTTLARFAGADQFIPRDRLVDGVDQSAALLFSDEQKARRDHVIIYADTKPEAIVKDQLKLQLPPPGKNPIVAKFFNLYHDTREEHSVSTEVGAWGGQEFVRILNRHVARKELYPDTPPAFGMPYEGVENIRPETQAAVDAFIVRKESPNQ